MTRKHQRLGTSVRSRALASPILLLGLCLAPLAHAEDRLLLMPEIIQDRNAPPGRGAGFGDATVLGVHGLAHASLTFGSFAPGFEVGGAWQDARRCNYGGMLRRRSGGMISDTALEVHTDQVLGRAAVRDSGWSHLAHDRASGPCSAARKSARIFAWP